MTERPNPYAAPRAAVDDVGEEHKRGRPGLVWVITIFMGLGIVAGTFTTIAALLGNPVGGEEAAARLKHLGPLDHVFSLVVTAISAFATVALFRLKRYAFPLLVTVFVLGVAALVVNGLLRPEYRSAFEQAGYWWGLLIGWIINLAIIVYVWRLRAKGLLRA